MESFGLLLKSLDQRIERKSLEDASVAVRSIARADCARLLGEMSGILVSGLPKDEALVFQRELNGRDFPTDLVADKDLPLLHDSLQIQRIERRDEVLVLTDSMSRVRVRPISDLVFLAAGYVNRFDFKEDWELVVKQSRSIHGHSIGAAPMVSIEKHVSEETESQFRLDLFFWSAPNRLHALLAKDTAIFHQNNPVRMRNEASLRGLLVDMAGLLPPERLNGGLRDPDAMRIHPNLRTYEKEIRWHFHHLKPRA